MYYIKKTIDKMAMLLYFVTYYNIRIIEEGMFISNFTAT